MPEITGRSLPLATIPEPARSAVTAFAEHLARDLGEAFSCLVVHGSSVRGEFREGRSDVDVIVILADTSLEVLEKLSNPLALARNSSGVDAMILKPSEVRDAADVFPVFYLDIQAGHVAVGGPDPFEGLLIPQLNVRVRIEQELREAKIRLRRAAADGFGDEDALAGAIVRKVRQVRGPLHALLDLRGVVCDRTLAAVYAAVEARYGLPASRLLAVREGPRGAHAVFRQLLDTAIEDVDRLGRVG